MSGLLAAQVPVLFALRETQLFELARCMRNHTVVAGQVVFRQGDAGASPTLPYSVRAMSCTKQDHTDPSEGWRSCMRMHEHALQGEMLT